MKVLRSKLFALIFTFIVGVSAFYLVSKLKSEIFSLFQLNSVFPNKIAEIEEVQLSDRIEVRFVKFAKGEFDNIAEFEVTNNTSENAYYYSYSKENYPFPKIKREGSIVPIFFLRCGTGIEKQALKSGESVTFQVPKSEIAIEQTENSHRDTDKPTQVGFPFQIGENGFFENENKRPDTYFWSEEIKFPN